MAVRIDDGAYRCATDPIKFGFDVAGGIIALHGVDDDATLVTDDHDGIGIAETDCYKDAIRHSDDFALELIGMRDEGRLAGRLGT